MGVGGLGSISHAESMEVTASEIGWRYETRSSFRTFLPFFVLFGTIFLGLHLHSTRMRTSCLENKIREKKENNDRHYLQKLVVMHASKYVF